MHGENTEQAELRPPAIKGGMRFWWRAIHGNLSLEDLKKQESDLFGGAGAGDDTRKSCFRIKLSSASLTPKQIDVLPHKNDKHFSINGYSENSKFTLQFIGKNATDIKKITKIFELTTILGGLGQRSRRGFGSVQIIAENDKTIDLDYINTLIRNINSNFNYSPRRLPAEQYPYIKQIELGNNYTNLDALLKTISSATHDHNKNGMFGSVNPKRYASPVYISIIKSNENYIPIITTLNATEHINLTKLNEFKGAIL